MSDTALLFVLLLLAAVAAAFAFAFFRKMREVTALAARQAKLEADKDKSVREQVREGVRREEARVARELEGRVAELESREREVERRQGDLSATRERLEEREAQLDDRAEDLTSRAEDVDRRMRALEDREKALAEREQAAALELERVAGLSAEQARDELLAKVEEDVRGEISRLLQKADEQARAAAEERARSLTLEAMETVRGAVSGEGTVSVVTLPSDEMKGRVIGREGRNIRALEHATGVDLLVDDTPQAILISTWDPLRRTIAARALRKLVEDGRIHPARIEEVVERTREETDEEAREIGEATAFELSATGLHERLVLLLGRLSFYRDQGHPTLQRAREAAFVAGTIADEMRLTGDALRRAGLLHEIARADETPLTAPVAIASADLAKRFGEPPEVTDPIRALAQSPDTPRTPAGVVLVTARRMVISRPGARNDNLQRYIERLEKAEQVALSHEGVERAFAVRAGRELRVHVRSEHFGDEDTIRLARRIAKEIESQVDYPGQIRVLVLRETRAISYAV